MKIATVKKSRPGSLPAAPLVVCAALLALALAPTPARACGLWRLHDREHGLTVIFYVETTLVDLHPRATGSGGPKKLIQRLGGRSPEEMHSLAGRRRDLYFEGPRILRRGRVVGTIQGETLKLGRTVFALSIERNPEQEDPRDPRQMWVVRVQKGDRTIADGKAMSLCMGFSAAPPPEKWDRHWLDKSRTEVRNRVILYLVWRKSLRR